MERPILSWQQQYVWMGVQKNPGIAHSNIEIPIRLGFDVDPLVLETSFRYVIARHEALNTAYRSDDDVVTPLTFEGGDFHLLFSDLSSLEAAAGATEVLRAIVASAHTPIPADHLPVRAHLLRLDAQESILILSIHHLACDGNSMVRLVGEVALLYDAACRRESLPLASLAPPRYSEFVMNQRDFLEGGRAHASIDYWRRTLNHEAQAFLRAHAPAAPPPVELLVKPFLFDATLKYKLEQFYKDSGKAPFTVLLTAFKLAVQQELGTADIMIASVFSGRIRKTEAPLGYLANIVLLKTNLGGDPSPTEALGRVARTVREAIAHQNVPLVWILENILDGDIRRLPSIHLNYIPIARDLIPSQGFVASAVATMNHVIPWTGVDYYDLGLRVIHLEESIVVECRYDARFLTKMDIDRIYGRFARLLAMICSPERPSE